MHIFYVSDKIQYFQNISQYSAEQGFSSFFYNIVQSLYNIVQPFIIERLSVLLILPKFPSCTIAKNPLLSFRFLDKKCLLTPKTSRFYPLFTKEYLKKNLSFIETIHCQYLATTSRPIRNFIRTAPVSTLYVLYYLMEDTLCVHTLYSVGKLFVLPYSQHLLPVIIFHNLPKM